MAVSYAGKGYQLSWEDGSLSQKPVFATYNCMVLGKFLHLSSLSFHVCKMELFPMPASMAIKKIWCDKLLDK